LRKRIRLGFVGFVLILFLVVGALTGAAVWSHAWQGRILPGIRIGDVDVAGLREQAAKEKLALLQDSYLSSPVDLVLAGDGRRWHISRRELGFRLEVGEAVQRAFLVGRSGSVWKRIHDIWDAYHGQVVLPLKGSVDRLRAQSVLSRFVKGITYPPEDAALVINDRGEVIVKPDKPGWVLDYQATLDALSRVEPPFDGEISLRLCQVQPKVRTGDILAMKITGLLASYTTYFDVSNVNRTYNINVAADALDNIVIKPGEVFSFNRVVGPRSKEAGYKEALVIVQDQFTPGIGGGVCQVSSTLYNAVLLAGLEIVERSNHSLPVTYVPFGRDATVAYGGCDLKFRNNTSGYLCIRTRVNGGALTVKMFGNRAEKKNITLESIVDKVLEPKVIKKEDPNLYVGKTVEERKGIKGYQVRVLSYTKNGNGQVTKRLVSNDLYKPVDQIIRVGTKPISSTPPLPETGQDQQPEPPVLPAPGPEQQTDSAVQPGATENTAPANR